MGSQDAVPGALCPFMAVLLSHGLAAVYEAISDQPLISRQHPLSLRRVGLEKDHNPSRTQRCEGLVSTLGKIAGKGR